MLIRPGASGIPSLWETAAFGPALPAAVVVSAIASGIGAAGQVYSGIQQANAANYQAQVAKNNATIATQSALYATLAGNSQEQTEALRTRNAVGAAITGSAAHGLDVNSGSALDLRTSAATMGELSDLNIRSNSAREAYGYANQAVSFDAQAELDKSQASSDVIGGALSAAGTLGQGYGAASSLNAELQRTGAVSNSWPSIGN
jgi:hypothetical protein